MSPFGAYDTTSTLFALKSADSDTIRGAFLRLNMCIRLPVAKRGRARESPDVASGEIARAAFVTVG
jgi:hypothetical protein